MFRPSQFLRGVTLNWVSLAVSVVVAFFLSPFVVHHLGNVAYGVWVLVLSMISYMGLLDLGLRGAVTHFVSKHHAKGNHQEASQEASGAFWLRFWIGLGIVAVSVILSRLAAHIVHIPSEMQVPARWAIIVTGTSLALTLTCGVFGGVLAALNRFDLLSTVTICQTFVRALGVVLVLRAGYGIVALALWEFCVIVLANAANTLLCFRAYPQLRISFERPDRAILGRFWRYSAYVFLIHVAGQLVFFTDNLVVGAFLSAVAVTLYAIGGNLIDYLRGLVTSLTMTFMPLASGFGARGEQDQLQRLLIHGTRAALLVALPLEVALFFRGPTFIGLWMGAQYAEVSGRVLQILLLSHIFVMANATSANIAYGLNKHRPVALWGVAEGAVNLGLSIFLVRRIGIYGVAWGTVIPALATQWIFFPRYVCHIVGVPVRHYLWQSWIRPILVVVPFGVACYLTDRFWHPSNLLHFFLEIGAVLPLFLFAVALSFRQEVMWLLRVRSGSREQEAYTAQPLAEDRG